MQQQYVSTESDLEIVQNARSHRIYFKKCTHAQTVYDDDKEIQVTMSKCLHLLTKCTQKQQLLFARMLLLEIDSLNKFIAIDGRFMHFAFVQTNRE